MKSVYDFSLLAACLCSNSRKYNQITMQFTHIIESYYGIFAATNKVCSIYNSFTGTLKIITLWFYERRHFAVYFIKFHSLKHDEIDKQFWDTVKHAFSEYGGKRIYHSFTSHIKIIRLHSNTVFYFLIPTIFLTMTEEKW